MTDHDSEYYVPASSKWPIIGALAFLFLGFGAAKWLHGNTSGPILTGIGALLFIYMLFGWFGDVIKEHRQGKLDNPQVIRSFRWGVIWFIFTEIALFAALFGALLYARFVSVAQLGGAGDGMWTHILIWPSFNATWPLLTNPNPSLYLSAKAAMNTWGIPALNTLVILLSGACITAAFWGVLKNDRKQAIAFLFFTIVLGITFLVLQVNEYWHAYTVTGVKLSSGIYGSTFYMITGLDGLHVFAGVIMLTVILWRLIRGDFTSTNHFGFAAVFWYWHFVEFIWLMVFILVYWL